jgi:DNA (cytosine-5)-methyltransferase 1
MLSPKFNDYREQIELRLRRVGYRVWWHKVQAAEFGVPQLRPRVVMVALQRQFQDAYAFVPKPLPVVTVGEALGDLMAAGGWQNARQWATAANRVAPTIVGGSKKHGGPDLGPTRARQEWAALGVDGLSIAAEPPAKGFVGTPKLTVPMVARIQGFPDDWRISGRKTAAYRQVGNAFPPPVARAVGLAIASALSGLSCGVLEAAE